MQKFSYNAGSTRCLLLIAAVMFFTSAQIARAQFWEKKPYQQWSKDDAAKMLADSPWAREMVLASFASSSNVPNNDRLATLGSTSDQPGNPGRSPTPSAAGPRMPTGGNDQTGAQVTYQVQVRSAKPVREAVVRFAQFGPKYQQLSAEQKQAADRSAEDFINAPPGEIVFWVQYSSSVQGQNVDLLGYWQAQSVASLKGTVWMSIPRADKAEPTYLAPGPGQSFEVRFPRPKEIPHDGSVVLEFSHPDKLAGQKGKHMVFEFKLKKMAVGGIPQV